MSDTREVRFTLLLPPDVEATDEQILEWVRFELHEISSIPSSNPLALYSIETEFGQTMID